ncbi:MAG: Uma2 family endonuclease [Flavobacteriales bacterium]|nr:Uma2 family endonuclease [Flavobacteriales bacterium]
MSKITDFSQLDLRKQYTYADYLTWTFDERIELIKGWIHKMSPAPKRKHQEVSLNLTLVLASYFKKCGCKIYEAPFDVRLKKNKGSDSEVNTVVQPDISIFCDLSKLDDRGAIDAPDLVVEITSDSTMKKDYNEKFNLYEENGVQEYWIVNPDSKSMEIFSKVGMQFESVGVFNINEGITEVNSVLFPDLQVNLLSVFKD